MKNSLNSFDTDDVENEIFKILGTQEFVENVASNKRMNKIIICIVLILEYLNIFQMKRKTTKFFWVHIQNSLTIIVPLNITLSRENIFI